LLVGIGEAGGVGNEEWNRWAGRSSVEGNKHSAEDKQVCRRYLFFKKREKGGSSLID
jgi:hypothetical protein